MFSKRSLRFLSFLAPLLSGGWLAGDNTFIRGDYNQTGDVTLADALAILGYSFIGAADFPCKDAGDLNDDGDLNASDAVHLVNYLFQGGPPPRSPFPGRGPDPDQAPDSLACDSYSPRPAGSDSLYTLSIGDIEVAGTATATVSLSAPIAVSGCSFGVSHDPGVVAVADARLLLDPGNFFYSRVEVTGNGVVVGALLNLGITLPPGDQPFLEIDLVPTGQPGESTPLQFTGGLSAPGSPAASLRVVDNDAMDIIPQTVDGMAHLPVPTTSFRRGDFNQSGEVTVNDAILILKYTYFGNVSPTCLDAGDVFDDERLELTDAIRLFGYLFQGQEAPPDPGPITPGPDPPDPAGELLDCASYNPAPPIPNPQFRLSANEVIFNNPQATAVVSLTTSEKLSGFSFGLKHDAAVIHLDNLRFTTTILNIRHLFSQLNLEPEGATAAVIFDPDKFLEAGADIAVAEIDYSRLGAPGSASRLEFTGGLGRPPARVRVETFDGTELIPLAKDGLASIPNPEGDVILTLKLNEPVSIRLDAARPQIQFKLIAPEAAGKPVLVTLSDPDPADANVLYVRFGETARGYRFDLAAEERDRAGQSLLIPVFQNRDCLIWAQATRIGPDRFSEVTLQARIEEFSLEAMSPRSAGLGGSRRLSVAISGSGFDATTSFALKHRAAGAEFAALSKNLLSSNRAEAIFELAGAAAGIYDLAAASAALGTAVLEGALEVKNTRLGPILKASLSAPDKVRYGRVARATLRYENAGDEEMDAPFFKVEGPPGADLALEREGIFQGSALQVLGVDPSGVPGTLAPGARVEIPVLFRLRSEGDVKLQLRRFTPAGGDFIGWDALKAPEGMAIVDWEIARLPLSVRFGAAWLDYPKGLAALAERLAHRGDDASSARRVFRFAVRAALGRPSSAVVGQARSAQTEAPLGGMTVAALQGGTVKSSAVTSADGRFTLDWLEGGQEYQLRVADHEPDLTLALPEDADVLGVDLRVSPAPNGLKAACPDCNEAGLPDQPLEPPAELFTAVFEKSARVLRSFDPNEKDGPLGQGDGKIVGADEELLYTVYFENLSTASGAAQEVVVEDLLEEEYDPYSFRMREVRAGGDHVFSLDAGGGGSLPISRDGFSAELVRLGVGAGGLWAVDTRCEYDPLTGRIRWTFTTLDPATYQFPVDPEAGFLPPNDAGHIGEGHVSFTVRPKTGLPELQELVNKAEIGFDENEPITTNSVTNRVSSFLPPSPPINPVPRSATAPAVEISSVLGWQPSARAASYSLFLWKSGEAKPALPSVSGLRSNGYQPFESLAYDTIYSWQVEARNSNGAARGVEWTFKTVTASAGKPGLASSPSPADDAEGQLRCPTLSWKAATGASAYALYLWPAGAPRPAQPLITGIVEAKFTVPYLLNPDTEYSWQVAALNRNGATEGPAWRFKTRAQPLHPFSRGDVSPDLTLDQSDAISLLYAVFLGQPPVDTLECPDALDANDDGELDQTDAIYILLFVFGGSKEPPPAPYPGCGLDPTDDKWGCADYPFCL